MRFAHLPASLRPLALSASAVQRRTHSVTARLHEPLRILFCGSDHFSIASLRALDEERRRAPHLIHSIDVVHRPAKPTGRGLKTLREVPIRHVAVSDLALPTHVIDTFTNWTPPIPINLIVAVSFGLLVPPRILSLAQHGGLNVHPSLLPDLRGAAPIEHAILQRRERTGVSIQTLHPQHFDQGTVLAQTPAPGIPIARDATATELVDDLAQIGAQMLVDVLRSRTYLPPHKDVAWYTAPIAHAPKTTKQDRNASFASKTMDDISAIQRALGDPWCSLTNGERLLMHKLVPADTTSEPFPTAPGLWVRHDVATPVIRAKCGAVAAVASSTYSGLKKGGGNAKVKKMLSQNKAPEDGLDKEWERVDQP